ncbi:MAG: hypothetical protein RL513_309 [Pseudomonadota bacterium]
MKDAGPPRFVPVLTEVVRDAPAADGPADAAREAQLAERVRARVLSELEPLVLQALRAVQARYAVDLEARVRAELADQVARLVDEALAPPDTD